MTSNKPCFIIAEAGVNHNGDERLAIKLIDAAIEAGADAIKFQSFQADSLVTMDAKQAQYQSDNLGEESSQYSMLKGLELTLEQTQRLSTYCQKKNIEFMSTPFDTKMVSFLADDIGVARMKIGSGDSINSLILLAVARTNLPIILSTGMCDIDEIKESLATIAWAIENPDGIPKSRQEIFDYFADDKYQKICASRVTVLQCITDYPAVPADMNLNSIRFIAEQTGMITGLSDHSLGWHLTLAAVGMGAAVIEKHITLSRDMEGPDHAASLEPDEFKEMVSQIRDVTIAFGGYDKKPKPGEMNNMHAARGSITCLRDIPKGEVFSLENLTVKRPGTGLFPPALWDILGRKTASQDYKISEQISSEYTND